ncbi:MAG: nucleotidyl transferase AbiEii/AbiGii toxin family protein [Acidobacteriia bacterium]|nr:nucleotidyl transferase AbiEii/AbiGii toxin family protein [Terriglobia bacterium]
MPQIPLDFQAVRRIAITALFADDFLFDKLVLKGGNALNLALGLSDRTSLDLDFSIENDFEDIEYVRQRVATALNRRFGSEGYVVFDFEFEQKPAVPRAGASPRWGGYIATFKLMERGKYEELMDAPDALRRDSLVIGPNQQRVFSIDLSKCEYVQGKRKMELDDYSIYVYSSEMIAIEKLRAICQQMPEYTLNSKPRARARDFFDIHLIVSKTAVDLASAENLELTRQIFAAKDVPLHLLSNVGAFREFHRPDWESVRTSTKAPLKEFGYYFEFVVDTASSMKSLWNK